VRLFTELQTRNREVTEALEQQTATAEILRVISASPTDVQPVFDTIVSSAARLLDGHSANVLRVAGDELHLAAMTSVSEAADAEARTTFPVSLSAAGVAAHVFATRRPYVVADVQTDPFTTTGLRHTAPLRGFRSMLTVPMIRHAHPVGVITVTRRSPGAFSEDEIALLQTFADQAVIAIENVRLFTELQTRNREVTEALEQQTATAEILRVISSSPTNVQPVLDAVATNAARICAASDALIFQVEGGKIHRLAHFGSLPYILPESRPLDHGSISARAVLERRTIHVPDIRDPEAHREYPESAATVAATGVRTILAVPLMRDEMAIGAITIRRVEARSFTDKQVELLKTFADQAVIAIENVRLFNEIQDKTQQLEAANRHKDEFLASMSHELRTPLNAVIGFSEVLLERMFGDVNDKQEEYLRDILASGRHLLSLINDILDLAKIEAGRMELDLEEFDVAQAIDNAVVLVRERATRKGLTLMTTVDHALGTVRGDQRKIKQVLLNLLSNAVKFTPEGGQVEVRGQRAGGEIEIAVTDTGIGIAAEDLEAVFEEFRQVGTDYAKKHEGTGLGLTLSRKFVELHGGRIWVKSQPGRGSTFAFTLPGGPWPAS
jgi:signal transduction histidine kinase